MSNVPHGTLWSQGPCWHRRTRSQTPGRHKARTPWVRHMVPLSGRQQNRRRHIRPPSVDPRLTWRWLPPIGAPRRPLSSTLACYRGVSYAPQNWHRTARRLRASARLRAQSGVASYPDIRRLQIHHGSADPSMAQCSKCHARIWKKDRNAAAAVERAPPEAEVSGAVRFGLAHVGGPMPVQRGIVASAGALGASPAPRRQGGHRSKEGVPQGHPPVVPLQAVRPAPRVVFSAQGKAADGQVGLDKAEVLSDLSTKDKSEHIKDIK